MNLYEMHRIALSAMQIGMPQIQCDPQHIVQLCDMAAAAEGWLPGASAPKNGQTIDIYFPSKGKNVTSRTKWMVDEGRWNGMAKGEELLGWKHVPVAP